jgi:hypothetical protein
MNEKVKKLYNRVRSRSAKAKPVEVEPVEIEKLATAVRRPLKQGKAVQLAKVVSKHIEDIGNEHFLLADQKFAQLARQAGISPASAEKALSSQIFRNSLAQFLDAEQVRKLRDKHLLGCEAKKVITLQVSAQMNDKDLKTMGEKFHGEFIGLGGLWFGNRQAYFAVPDHQARYKYFDQVFRVLGEYNDKTPPPQGAVNQYENLSVDEIKDLLRGDF